LTLEGAARTLLAVRSDYGPNRISLRLAFRPFVDAFQFRGRSTRTEVVAFWLLGTICNLFTLSIGGLSPRSAIVIGAVWAILWGWPWIPLLVRRLHDQDRSGRWALLTIAGLALIAVDWLVAPDGDGPSLSLSLGFTDLHRHVAWTPLTMTTALLFVLSAFATLALYLMPCTTGANCYGPDPRSIPNRR
jgi:uncharacterized membrane protein YhaH (DUF805 family)